MPTSQESPNRSPRGRAVLAPLVVAMALLGIWMYAKCLLFDQLEYTTDIFQYLIGSRSLFQGLAPFWTEPHFGGRIHNYVLLLSWYPFTSWLGAYGLFAGLALLMAGVIAGLASEINRSEAWRRELYWTVAFALVLGPVSFWLWDDPIYGWATEVAFVPLSFLFAMALVRRSRLAWLWGAMLILNREEGAVVAWAVHVLFVLMETGPNEAGGTEAFWRHRRVRLAVLTAAYLAVFAANVGLLLARQPSVTDSRIGAAVARVPMLWADRAWQTEMLGSVGDAFGLWLTGAMVAAASLRVRWVLLVALVTVPLAALAAFGALVYGVDAMRYHGVAWPPRFAMLWGPLIAGSVYSIMFASTPVLRNRRVRVTVCVIAGVSGVCLQAYALNASRGYDLVARLESIVGRGPRLGAAALTGREDRVMRCLGERLPYDTRASVPGFLDARFHRQQVLVGPRNAQLFVCDQARPSRWSIPSPCVPNQRLNWATEAILVDHLFVAFSPGYRPLIEPCLAGTTSASHAELDSSDDHPGGSGTTPTLEAAASARVTVTVTGAGTGQVRSPGQPDCRLRTCAWSYPLHTVVELSALPDPGSQFAGWTGNCASPNFRVQLSVNSSTNCTASFEPAPAVTKLSPAQGATVTGTPVLLRWQPVVGAHYFVCVSQAPITGTCDTGYRDANAPQLEQAGLAPGVYFWQVMASTRAGRFNLNGASWSFTVPLPSGSSWGASVFGPSTLAFLTLAVGVARRYARKRAEPRSRHKADTAV